MGLIQSTRHNLWWRIGFGVLLLGMILMRLVWMQLRPYRARVDAKAYVSLVVFEKLAPAGNLSLGQIPQGLRFLESPEMSVIRPLGSPLFRGFHGIVGSGENLNERFFVRNHQSLLMAIVFFMVLMVRILSRSWPVALMVGAMLMSRGRLLTAVGHITLDISVMTFIAGFFAVLVHSVRTAATPSFLGAMVILFGAILMDTSLVGLGVALPGALLGGYFLYVSPWGARLRGSPLLGRIIPLLAGKGPPRPQGKAGRARLDSGTRRGPDQRTRSSTRLRDSRVDYWGGGLLRPLRMAFLRWCLARKRWISLVGGFLAVSLIGVFVSLGLQTWYGGGDVLHLMISGQLFQPDIFDTWGFGGVDFVLELLDLEEWVSLVPDDPQRAVVAQTWAGAKAPWGTLGLWMASWFRVQAAALDSHLILSLLVVGLCLIQSPQRGYPGFTDVCWTLFFGSLGLLAMAMVSDMFDHAVLLRRSADLLTAGDIPWRPRVVVIWLEPVLLSLGVAGIFNLWSCYETPKDP